VRGTARKLMLSCGEASGDLYAGALVRALRRLDPEVDVFGLGSTRFQEAGGRVIADFHGLSVTGLTEALRVLPRSFAAMQRLVEAARRDKPHALIVIDYPDFNFRLMTRIKRLGIPIVYYISPQLWAWRSGRIRHMKRMVDLVLPIFPFEEAIYRREGMNVRFVGHPLVDLAAARYERDVFLRRLNLDPGRPLLALLPGSRRNELEQLARVIADAVPAIAARVPGVQFLVARAPHLHDGLFEPFGLSGVTLRIADAETDDVLHASDAVITASGTATVQTALHGKPMVVIYRVTPMTYRLARRLAHVDTYAMVNLIAGERIVVELIQDACTADAVANEAVRLLTDADYRKAMTASLADVRAKLGGPGASDRAAQAILELAGHKVP
jgi:lipid-A-disaccharide synthase